MPSSRRAYLLVLGIAFSSVVFALGTTFTQGVEAPEQANGAWILWILPAAMFALPFWLPALVPARYAFASRIIRSVSALFVIVPLWYAGVVALHQLAFFPGRNFSVQTFLIAAVLSLACVGALGILLVPEARKPFAEDP